MAHLSLRLKLKYRFIRFTGLEMLKVFGGLGVHQIVIEEINPGRSQLLLEYRADIRSAVWEKYLFIEPVASAGCFTGQDFGGLLDDPERTALLAGLLDELAAVAAAQGVPLPENIAPGVLYMASDLAADHTGKVLGVSSRGVREIKMLQTDGFTPGRPYTAQEVAEHASEVFFPAAPEKTAASA